MLKESKSELAATMICVAKQDRRAFEALYKATNSKLYGVILRILYRPCLADEVMQDVYIRIWERAGDYRAELGSPITWLTAIARNRALDMLRQIGSEPFCDPSEDHDGLSEAATGLEQIEQSERMQALVSCLNTLEPDKRDMILLAYYGGLSRKALAKRYDSPTPTIKTWLRRSLAQLKHCLTHECVRPATRLECNDGGPATVETAIIPATVAASTSTSVTSTASSRLSINTANQFQ